MKRQLICVNLVLWLVAMAAACDWTRFDNNCEARSCAKGSPTGAETFISMCYKRNP
jgi:hypothetical protein